MEFERIKDILKNFIYERQQRKQQIADIELKRTQLAQKRNEKKIAIKNMDYACASSIEIEIHELGRQISELGNQSQDLQNKLDARFLEIKTQVNDKIDNLMTLDDEKVFSIEELNEIKKDFKNGNWQSILNKEICKTNKIIFEEKLDCLVQKLINEQKEIIEKCEQIEEKIALPFVGVEEISIEELQPIGEVNVEEISPISEIVIEEIEPIEEIQIEETEIISETIEFQTMEDVQIEDIEPIVEIEPVTAIIEENNPGMSIQDIIEKIEEEIIILEKQEQEEKYLSVFDGKIKILNIIAKIVSGEVVYNAQISNGETIKIYPTKANGENILIKDKENRAKLKDILLTYAISEHKILDKKVVKDIDPTICQILNEFAHKYNCDAQDLIYNYVMSFSKNGIAETYEIPQITYNFSFIEEADISKKEKSILMKICKNARKNDNIEVIGYSNALIKAKYFFRRIFANNANALSEGRF